MTLQEAIVARHSVRHYQDRPIDAATASELRQIITQVNKEHDLHFQLVTGEERAFKSMLSYGTFKGVKNYVVLAAPKGRDEQVGYWSSMLLLQAQAMGLNTCWVGLTFKKVADAFVLGDDEKVYGMLAIGYGATQGVDHKRKTPQQVSNITPASPEWFVRGVNAAVLAPTAVNQQKFMLELQPDGRVRATATRALVGMRYTKVDLGIVKCHFELAAGRDNFEWA